MGLFKQIRKGIRTGVRDAIAYTLYGLAPGSIFKDRRYFDLWQKKGFHALPVHFYSPVPDTREMTADLFTRQSELPGVDLREAAQLALLRELAQAYGAEYRQWPVKSNGDPTQFFLDNRSLSTADASLLYAMVRHHRPQRVIEIGAGYSTLVIAQALRANQAAGAAACRFSTIDPYPRPPVLGGQLPGLSDLKVEPVQAVPPSYFEDLGAGDILFIDSSHVLKTGSDVQHEFLEILPRLKPGVVVHVHDILWPEEYPRVYPFEKRWFWNEQYLLQAFLCLNSQFEVLIGGHYLGLKHAEAFKAAFERPEFPGVAAGSFWFRRKA